MEHARMKVVVVALVAALVQIEAPVAHANRLTDVLGGDGAAVVNAHPGRGTRVVATARFRKGVNGWSAGRSSAVRRVERGDGALGVRSPEGEGRVRALGPRLHGRSAEEVVATVRLRAVRHRQPAVVQLLAEGRGRRSVLDRHRVRLSATWRRVTVRARPGEGSLRLRVVAGGRHDAGRIQIDSARVLALSAPSASADVPVGTGGAGSPPAPSPGTSSGSADPVASPAQAAAPTPAPAPGGDCRLLDYSLPSQGALDWSDEFSGTTLDPVRWRVRDGESLSYDQARILARNVSVGGGLLAIEARREAVAGRAYTTGYVDTIGRYDRQWGRWEVRAKLPTPVGSSRGVWPAFWLRGTSTPGEIDVVEAWGEPTVRTGYRSGSYQWTVHEDTMSPEGSEKRSGWGTPAGSTPVANDFHLYAVDWSPDCLVFSFDRQVVGVVTPADAPWLTTSLSGPANIRLNLQVGQSYWGFANPADGLLTALPAQLLVDYVRVYRPIGG